MQPFCFWSQLPGFFAVRHGLGHWLVDCIYTLWQHGSKWGGVCEWWEWWVAYKQHMITIAAVLSSLVCCAATSSVCVSPFLAMAKATILDYSLSLPASQHEAPVSQQEGGTVEDPPDSLDLWELWDLEDGEGNDTGGDHDSSPPSKKFTGEEPCSSRLQELLLDDLLGAQQAPQDHANYANKPYVKWVYTPQGVVPYVLDKETNFIHCGFVKMKMMVNSTTPGGRIIQCLSGCGPQCCVAMGRQKKCECYCHHLQHHYDTRNC